MYKRSREIEDRRAAVKARYEAEMIALGQKGGQRLDAKLKDVDGMREAIQQLALARSCHQEGAES